MNSLRIPPTEFDAIRTAILATDKWELELSIWNRSGDCYVQLRSADGKSLISETTADAFSAEVRRYFEKLPDSARLWTRVFLRTCGGTTSLFFTYRTGHDLLEVERGVYEVPEQIMRIVRFLEEEQEADVEFRFGHDPDDPFKFAEFVLSKRVEMAGCGIISQCTQKARPSLGFILEVGGEYLERILLDNPPALYGCAYVANFVLEEENGVIYFRMYNDDQRFFSVEKDKLRGEKS